MKQRGVLGLGSRWISASALGVRFSDLALSVHDPLRMRLLIATRRLPDRPDIVAVFGGIFLLKAPSLFQK